MMRRIQTWKLDGDDQFSVKDLLKVLTEVAANVDCPVYVNDFDSWQSLREVSLIPNQQGGYDLIINGVPDR